LPAARARSPVKTTMSARRSWTYLSELSDVEGDKSKIGGMAADPCPAAGRRPAGATPNGRR
jgi:hypothetical protein